MLKIYTTTQCAYCAMVKKFLDLKKVAYEVVNIEENPEREAEAIALSGGKSVPITTNGEKVVVGWNAPKLMELL
jgi:alkyl hydroperoxide reductase subunit F